MERVIEVLVELDGTSQFVGRLWSRSLKGRESASFEYDKKWIASAARFADASRSPKLLSSSAPVERAASTI